MPVAMAGTWLGIGTALIVVLLLLGAFMPRPQSETPLVSMDSVASRDRKASDYAVKGDSPAKGDGNAATEPGKENKDAKPGSNGQTDNKQGGDPANNQKSSESSQGGKSQKGNSGDSKQGNQSGNSKQSDNSSGQKDNQASDKKDSQDDRSSGSGKGSQPAKSSDSKASKSRKATSSSSSWTTKLPQSIQSVAKVLQWVVIGLLVVGIIGLVLWKGLAFLANFTQWARSLLEALRNLWAGLFGARTTAGEETGETGIERRFKRPRPFAVFRNPFLDGSAETRSAPELVRYSFAALQAWAFEQGLGRSPEETPLEFVARLGQELPALETDSQKLAILLVRVEYGQDRLPTSSVQQVQQFWKQLEALAEQPLSA